MVQGLITIFGFLAFMGLFTWFVVTHKAEDKK